MSETLSQDPDTLGSGYGLASNYQPTSAAPSSTVQDPPGSNLPPFSTFAADMDTATGYATDRFLSDTRLLDISNWDYYTEARILDRSENGLSIITSQPQYRPWESKPIDSTSQHGFAQTTAVTTFADAFAQNGVSKLPSFQSQFQSFNEPVTTSEPTLTTLTNLTPVSPNSSSPSLTTLNSNFHTLSAVNPRNYPLVPAPIQAREIPSIQQQFMDERHIQLYAHPTNITTINPAGSIFQSQNGTIIQNSQLMGSPTVLTVIKTEPDLKMTALAPQDTGLKIQNLHPTHFQNPMSTMLDNNGLYNGLDKKLNGLNASSGSPTRNDFRKKERRKMRASSLESSAESDGASSNMDLGSESSGQVAAVSSTASFKTHHSMPTNNSIDIDEISGGGGGVDKQVKKKRKRCGECIGCQRKDNCGDCAPCRNDKSHQICKQRRCEKLTEKKNLYGDQSYMRGESRRGRGKGRGAGSYRGRKPSGPVSLSNSSVPEPSVPSSRPSPQPVHMLKPEQPVQQQQQQPMAPMPFYADPTRFTTPVWQAEPAQTWPQGQFIQQIPAPAQPTLEAYPTQQYPNGIYQATYQQGGFETNTFYTGAVQVLTNARPPSVPDHSQMTPRTNGSYSHTPSPVSGQPQPQQSAPRNNLSGQYQEYVSNQGYVAPSTPTGVDNSSRPGSVNSTVNVPVSNQNFQQQQPGGGFTSVSSTNFSPGSNTNPNYVNANSGNEKPGYPQVNSHPQLVSHSSSGYPGNQYGGNLQQEEQQTQHWSLNPENIIWETNVQQNDESAKRIGEHDIQYDHNRPPDSPHDHNSRVNLNSRIKTMILNKQQIVERKPEDEQNETENKTGHFLWYSHHRRPPEFLNGGGGGVSTPTPSFDDTFGKSRQKYHQPITIRNNDNLNQFTTNRYPNARIPHPYNEKNFYKQPGHALESVQMFPPPLKQSQMPAEHSYYNQNLHNTTQLENSNYFKFRNGFQTQEHILKTPAYKDLQPNPYVIYNKKNNYKSNELVLKPNELTDKVSNKQSNYTKNIHENANFPNYKTEKNILHPSPIPTQQYSHGNTKPIHDELMDSKEPRTVLRPTQPIQMNEPHNMNFYKQDLVAKQEIVGADLCNSKDSNITKNENHCVNPKYLVDNFRAQPIKEFPTQIQNSQENQKFYNQINVSENIKPNQSQNEPKSAGTYDPKAFEAKNVNFFRNLNQSINLKEKEMFPNQLDSPNNANYNAKVHYENLKDKHASAFFKTDLKPDNAFKSGEIPSLINRIDSNEGKFIGNDHKKKIEADEKNKFSGSDIPICNCFPPDKFPPEPGSYYTHLGCSNDLVNLRKDLEKRTGVNGKALRIEKVCYTGKEGKSVQGCPLAKWIIRRSNYDEKYLVMVKHRQGHFCISAYIVICLVAWEGVPEADADDMYSMLGDKLNKFGLATNRRCATNEQRTCACQGLDPKTCGASFSFGCSWSMYYNGCKFARSKIVRKFRLTEKTEEQHLETQLQNLASDLTPLYKILAPASFKNQCVYEDEAGECRLGSKEGKPFSGVTACLDFCAHAHKDSHNMNNGCTVVVTLTKERSLAKAEDEQLHVLPLYTVDCTDEFGSKESQDDKIKDGSVEVLNSYQCEVRIRTVPLQPCRRRKKKDDDNAKESPVKKDNVSSRLSSSSGYDSSRSQTPLTPNKNVDQMLQSSQISSTVLDSPLTPKSWTYDSPGYNQLEENWYQTASSNINSPENVFYNNAKPTVLSQTKPTTAFTPTYPKIELQTRSPQSAQNNLLQNKVQDNYSGIRNGNRLFSHCNTGIDFNTGILNNPTNDEISSSRMLHLDKANGFYPKSDFQSEPFKIPFTPESSPVRVSPKTFPSEASQPFGESQDVQRLNHISHMQCYQRERATVASPYVYPDLYHLPPGTQNLQNMFHRLPPHEQNLELMTPFRGHRNIEYDQMETYQRRERNSEIPLECSQPMSFKSQIQQNGFSISGKDSTNNCNGSYQNFSFEHKKEVQNLNLNLNSSKSVEDDKILLDSPRKSSPPKLNLIDTNFTPIQIPKSYQLCNPFDDFGDYGIKKQESRIISNSGYDPYLSPSWQSPKSWDVNVPLPEQTESLGKVVDVVDNAESFKDSQIGGVAIALGHGSVLFECAKHELHATTALKRPNRKSPTRISLVFYQHRNLNRAKHGWDEWEEKTRLKKLGLNDAQNTDLKFKVGNEKIDVPDFNTVLLKNNNEVLMRAPTLTTVSVTTLFPMYPCIVTGPYTETQSFG